MQTFQPVFILGTGEGLQPSIDGQRNLWSPKRQKEGVSSIPHFINSEIQAQRLASNQGGNQHPTLCNQTRKARPVSPRLPSTGDVCFLGVKTFHSNELSPKGQGCRQESILLDPRNTEEFCKGSSTTSTCKTHSLKKLSSSGQSTSTSTHHMPGARRQCPKEIPLVCTTGCQRHPCKVIQDLNYQNLQLHIVSLTGLLHSTGPTTGPTWSTLQAHDCAAWFSDTFAGQLCP